MNGKGVHVFDEPGVTKIPHSVESAAVISKLNKMYLFKSTCSWSWLDENQSKHVVTWSHDVPVKKKAKRM